MIDRSPEFKKDENTNDIEGTGFFIDTSGTAMSPRASTTWPGFTITRASMPRQSRCTNGRWPSGRRRWDRNIHM